MDACYFPAFLFFRLYGQIVFTIHFIWLIFSPVILTIQWQPG